MTILTEIMMIMTMMTILRADLFFINNAITPQAYICIAIMFIEIIRRSMTSSVMMMQLLMLWTILMTMDTLTTWIVIILTADTAV